MASGEELGTHFPTFFAAGAQHRTLTPSFRCIPPDEGGIPVVETSVFTEQQLERSWQRNASPSIIDAKSWHL